MSAAAPQLEIPTPASQRARRGWWRRAAPFAIAAAAIVLAWGWRRSPVGVAGPPRLASADVRGIEGRISYAGADMHRPYVVRGGPAARPPDSIPLETLAALEHRGDLHGVAAGYLLLGDPSRAAAYLDRAAPGPDVASDRALLQLAAGHPADALIALDAVLEAAPRHPQALWNRALALADLGLTASAADAFAAAAELGERGWSDEARARQRELADRLRERQAAFLGLARTDGPRLATAPGAVAPALARRFPGMARLWFYDAVRGAESADTVRALLPLARALDGVYRGEVLAGYAERVSRADFAVRGPLAHRYAELAGGARLDEAAARDLLAALRAAHQDDLVLGALVLTSGGHVPAPLLPELTRLAAAMHDPWFDLLAIEQQAGARAAAGDHAGVEVLGSPALAACSIDYRCANLDLLLGQSYLALQRLAEARRVLADGWQRARRGGEWYLEQRLLSALAQLEGLADDVAGSTLPLVRAYVGELTRREPARCELEVWGRELVANVLVNRTDLDGARAELARAAAAGRDCAAARPNIASVFVKAHALRDPRAGAPEDVAALRAQIAALRADPAAGPGERAVLDQTEGRLLVERDRATATALLERAIEVARTAPPGDVDARKARSYAYSVLTLDAARAGEWDRVWRLLGDDAGFTVPARCALGAAVEDRSSAVVIRDATGAGHGVFDGARPGPAIDAATLVPAPLRDALRACPSVDVVARPPVQGLPLLLPSDVAWSYRLRAAPLSPGEHGPRVVIANTEPPSRLGLARLRPWVSSAPVDVLLEGAAATPSRVLAEIARAGFVEIHAHGVLNVAEADASSLMLSSGPDHGYALTAAAIRRQPLAGHPIVILAACQAATSATYRHEAWSLPAAFIAAGARAVIASTDVISDGDAGTFFDDVHARIDRGASPELALRDARTAWLAGHPGATWVRSLMVFQ